MSARSLLPLAAVAVGLTGCLTFTPYDETVDKTLTTLQTDTVKHYDEVARKYVQPDSIDPKAVKNADALKGCRHSAFQSFWDENTAIIHVLGLRAGYIEKDERIASEIKVIAEEFQKQANNEAQPEKDWDAGNKGGASGGPCLDPQSAITDSKQLEDLIGATSLHEIHQKCRDGARNILVRKDRHTCSSRISGEFRVNL